MEAAVTYVMEKIGDYTISVVGRHLGYCFYYKSNIENLQKGTGDLKTSKGGLQRQVDRATKNLEEIEDGVRDWLREVSETIEEADKLIVEQVEQGNRGCRTRLFPSYWLSRYRLSKKAQGMTLRIGELGTKGKFDKVSYSLPHQINFENKSYKSFRTRGPTLMGIMKALRDPNIRMIGVHGMPGIGKTMLAEDVARQAKDKELFSVVVMVTVSQKPDWKNIQQQIGNRLGLTSTLERETDDRARAEPLKRRLSGEKEVLLILDDLWEKVELQDWGICLKDDQEKCKILVTSRSQELLRDDMGISNNFGIKVLSDSEAEDLFNEIVGDLTGKPDFQSLRTQVLEECAGLPLSISIVASALRNKSLQEWKFALKELKKGNFEMDEMDEIYKKIRFSYDFLRSDVARSLFLLCSMHEEDANIDLYRLLIQGMGWGLFQEDSLEDAINTLLTWVNKLKARYLLLEGRNYWTVKMHDVVRDVGILIASKDRRMYNIGSNSELEQCIRNKKLESSSAISLQYYGVDNLPEILECEQLELLLMRIRKSSGIPDDLFKVMKNLRHMDFSGSILKPIPSSFQYLKNLQSLILNGCQMGDVAVIGELKSLEALSFRDSQVDRLPEQIGELTCLRLLDLSGCDELKVIAPNVISKLTRLEELNMLDTYIEWEVEGFNGERKNASLTELNHLLRLKALQLNLPKAHSLPKDLLRDRLDRFVLQIDDDRCYWPSNKLSTNPILCTRSLKLGLTTSRLKELGLGMLLERSEELHLDGLRGLNSVISELDGEGFSKLKHLVFENNYGVKYIVDHLAYQHMHPCNVFQCLEVSRCKELRNLFCASVANLLSQLEEIEVEYCTMIREMVTDDNQGVIHNEILFPRLQSLTLTSAPKLLQFYGLNSSEEMIPAFFNEKFLASSTCFQNLADLVIHDCGSLKYLFLSSASMNILVQLKKLEIRDCDMMEEIINTNRATDKQQFPHLSSLTLQNLPKLKRFCAATSIEFSSLVNLNLRKCPELTSFVSISENDFCTPTFLFNDNVAFPSLQEMNIKEIDKVEMIWQTPSTLDSFCKLEVIEVDSCNGLRKMLIPSYILGRLQRLSSMTIKRCEMLEEVFEVQRSNDVEDKCNIVTTAQLERLWLWNLPKLKHVCRMDKEEESETIPEFEFPQLSSFELKELPELVSFYPGLYSSKWPSFSKLIVERCAKVAKIFIAQRDRFSSFQDPQDALFSVDERISFPQLKYLFVTDCGSLRYVFSSPAALNLVQLVSLGISGCVMLEEVISTDEFTNRVSFPKLDYLTLEYLPKLTRFCNLTFFELPSLTELIIKENSKSTSNTRDGEELKEILIESDDDILHPAMLHFFGAHVAIPNLKKMELRNVDILKLQLIAKELSFPKLEEMEVENCGYFMKMFPSNMLPRLPSLRRLIVEKCEVEELLIS